MQFNQDTCFPYALSTILDPEKFQALVDAPEIAINAADVLAAWTLFCELHHGGQGSDLYKAGCIVSKVFKPGRAWKSDPGKHDPSVQYHYCQIQACNPEWLPKKG